MPDGSRDRDRIADLQWADDGAGERGEGEMQVGAPLVTYR